MGAGIATIISSIVAAGSSYIAGERQGEAVEAANAQSLRLAKMTRADTLAQQSQQNKFAKQQIGISQRQLAFQEREAGLDRTERAEERGYNRMQKAADRYSQYLNNKQALVQNRMSPLMRSK